MITEKEPLISCLCITKNDVSILKRAIDCFKAQTYLHKELIIVKQDLDEHITNYIKELNDPSIRYINGSQTKNLTLGQLRNLSIEISNGDFFCNWDDDDWYHNRRLEVQVNAVINNFHPSSILTNMLILDEINKQAWFSIFRLWEGSILCRKELINENLKYPSVTRQEDSHFLNLLLASSKVYPVVSSNLYIYVYHGKNTWDRNHFQNNLFRYSQKLSKSVSQLLLDIISNKYDVNEASELLNKEEFLKELDFFYYHKVRNDSK